MIWKPKILMLLVYLHVRGTSPTTEIIDLSAVKSFVVERRKFDGHDYFTVIMKPNHTCTNEPIFASWCKSLAAVHVGSENRTFCKCRCHAPTFSFLAPLKKCVVASQAGDSFGGCNRYFDEKMLLAEHPVNLTVKKQYYKTVPVQVNGTTCELKGEYFDYSGFQSNGTWQSICSGFFTLVKTESTIKVGWKANAGVSGKLAGRIIRLMVTCKNFESCFLLKALGTVTHYAYIRSSTSSPSPIVSSSNVDSQVPFLSPISSVVMTSSSSALSSSLSKSKSITPSTSSLQWQLSFSSPHSLTMLSSSLSLILSTSSTVSPSPSLVLTSFLQPTPSQTSRLPAMSAGEIEPTSKVESSFNLDGRHTSTAKVAQPIEPSKTTSTVSASSPVGNGHDSGSHDKQTGESDNGLVIGAAVGGAVVLGAIVIIIFVFRKRRRARKTTEKQGKQGMLVKNPVYGTSTNEIPLERSKGSQTRPSSAQENQQQYESIIISNGKSNGAAIYSSPEHNYDNCNVYQSLEKEKPGSPVYQSLIASQGKAAHTTGLPKHSPRTSVTGPPNSKAKLVTGTPKSKPTATGNQYQKPVVTSEPVYNVLEGQDGGQDYETTNVDPLYNDLEGPDATYETSDTVLENPGAESDPLYNVLEGPEANQNPPERGPSSAQEPLYNVLENSGAGKDPVVKPNPNGLHDEPVHNVLEESDPDAGPSEPCLPSGHDNPAYEQTHEFNEPYAAVHRPAGAQRESFYEPLRGPTQDLYAPLG